MASDCAGTYAPLMQLPKPISGLNIWSEADNNETSRRVVTASNRGVRRGNFVINPQWTSENVLEVPKSMGAVYEPAPQDFYGARALHAKTWEQAAIYPGHGTNSHLASPGFVPYKYTPVSYRSAKEEVGGMWPWNQQESNIGPAQTEVDGHADLQDGYDNYLLSTSHTTSASRDHARSQSAGDVGSRDAMQYVTDPYMKLPHPFSTGCNRDLTDSFTLTYERHLPQMAFREAHHVAPFHAYMTSCDWGESSQSIQHED